MCSTDKVLTQQADTIFHLSVVTENANVWLNKQQGPTHSPNSRGQKSDMQDVPLRAHSSGVTFQPYRHMVLGACELVRTVALNTLDTSMQYCTAGASRRLGF